MLKPAMVGRRHGVAYGLFRGMTALRLALAPISSSVAEHLARHHHLELANQCVTAQERCATSIA